MQAIEKILISGASSESDLYKLADSIGLNLDFVGSIFHLPKKLVIGKYIILIHPNPNVNSGHWTAIDVLPDKILYFDSYGQPPPQKIVKLAKNKQIYYNNDQIQALNHSHCGVYSIYFLMHGAKGLKRFQVINSYG